MMLILLTGLFGHPAFADDDSAEPEESERQIIYKQKTEIDFEGLDVQGEIQKPASSLVLERKKAAFNPLIKIRTNWNDLIEEGSDEAK